MVYQSAVRDGDRVFTSGQLPIVAVTGSPFGYKTAEGRQAPIDVRSTVVQGDG
jgi:enamine deaminase RidA (YjgF/YER057c/UK114 family)